MRAASTALAFALALVFASVIPRGCLLLRQMRYARACRAVWPHAQDWRRPANLGRNWSSAGLPTNAGAVGLIAVSVMARAPVLDRVVL
jgi:hypothetical protein